MEGGPSGRPAVRAEPSSGERLVGARRLVVSVCRVPRGGWGGRSVWQSTDRW